MADDFAVNRARATLAKFTPEKPLWLSKSQYDALARDERLSDMMDRVRVTRPLPLR